LIRSLRFIKSRARWLLRCTCCRRCGFVPLGSWEKICGGQRPSKGSRYTGFAVLEAARDWQYGKRGCWPPDSRAAFTRTTRRTTRDIQFRSVSRASRPYVEGGFSSYLIRGNKGAVEYSGSLTAQRGTALSSQLRAGRVCDNYSSRLNGCLDPLVSMDSRFRPMWVTIFPARSPMNAASGVFQARMILGAGIRPVLPPAERTTEFYDSRYPRNVRTTPPCVRGVFQACFVGQQFTTMTCTTG